MGFILGSRSLQKLVGVHVDLRRVVIMASRTAQEFIVTEGVRTLARQKQLLEAGASRTMRSRHLDGHAVDLAPLLHGEVRWDWPLFRLLNDVMQESAGVCGVMVEWGGNWKTFKDGPHWQLPWKTYPSAG